MNGGDSGTTPWLNFTPRNYTLEDGDESKHRYTDFAITKKAGRTRGVFILILTPKDKPVASPGLLPAAGFSLLQLAGSLLTTYANYRPEAADYSPGLGC